MGLGPISRNLNLTDFLCNPPSTPPPPGGGGTLCCIAPIRLRSAPLLSAHNQSPHSLSHTPSSAPQSVPPFFIPWDYDVPCD